MIRSWISGHIKKKKKKDLNSLVEVQRYHFLHAVLDHLRGEEVGFSLFVNADLAEVLQQNGTDSLGGMGHVDGPVVAHHLAHVRQSAAVVQVEMAERGRGVRAVKCTGLCYLFDQGDVAVYNKPDDHTVQKVCQAAVLDYIRKVWEASLQ